MMTPSSVVQAEDVKYIKRRVKSGSIDVHPTETALIVNYEVEATILGESENPVLSDKKDCQKIIRLKSLNKNSDCAALAREVIKKCTLIHPSKVGEVEHLIYFLQSRKENVFSGGIPENSGNVSSCSGFDSPLTNTPGVNGEKASFSKLEEYVELLYEDLPEKIKGATLIMQLSRDHDNLEELARSDAVFSALARVLREDYKKSTDLSTNIVSIFHSFSLFSQFHPLILQYKVGSLCISILEYELARFSQWKSEISAGREGRKETPPASRLPLPRRSSTPSPADRKRLSLLPVPKTSNPQRTPANEDDSSQKKFAGKVAKQDRLLKVCLSLLLNIAETLKVENKIRKGSMVAMLVECLERSSVPLLITVAKFLVKLSARVENKDEMGKLNVIEKLPKLLQINNLELEKATLTLLFNLSFDSKLREKMIRVGFLQKLVSLLGDERHAKTLVLKLLYHLSMADRVKPMFTFTDCLPKLMKMVVGNGSKSEEYSIAVAVCINVALSSRCAEVMCSLPGDCLEQLRHTALAYHDILLMKLLRNLSMHDSTKHHFLAFVEDLLRTLVSCENVDFSVETAGTLANLPLDRVNIAAMVEEHEVLPWLSSVLAPSRSDDDLILEAVMIVAAASASEPCAKLFCKADVILALIELLKCKQEDDEIVLQIIYVFYQISRHTDTRKYLTTETEAAAYLIDLMTDNNAQIRRVCDACMEIIKEEDAEYDERVKAEKFRSHNSHWLAMVENKALETSLNSLPDLADSNMPHYNLLNQSLLLQTGSHISLTNAEDIEIVSNNPHSEEGSRPVSRYESEGEDFTDSLTNGGGKRVWTEEAMRNAFRNLVIPGDAHTYFHIDTPTSFN